VDQLTPVDCALAILVATIGATLQGTIGFGLGMFGAPLLLLINPDFIPAPLLCAALVLTLSLTHRERHSVIVADLGWALTGRAVGIACGVVVLANTSPDRMRFWFGILLLLAVAMSASGISIRPRPMTLSAGGVLSGFMGTTISIGGPPMALVYQHASGPRIRGTLSAFFTVGVIMSLTGLSFVGLFGRDQLILAAVLIPGVVLGLIISRQTARLLDRRYTRTAVLAASAVIGLIVLLG
jgi:uncharacterized membrane protein YfcA